MPPVNQIQVQSGTGGISFSNAGAGTSGAGSGSSTSPITFTVNNSGTGIQLSNSSSVSGNNITLSLNTLVAGSNIVIASSNGNISISATETGTITSIVDGSISALPLCFAAASNTGMYRDTSLGTLNLVNQGILSLTLTGAEATFAGNINFSPNRTYSGVYQNQALISTFSSSSVYTVSYSGTTGSTGIVIGLGLYLNVNTTVDAQANSGAGQGNTVLVLNYDGGASGGGTTITNYLNVYGLASEVASHEFVSGRDFLSIQTPSGTYAHSMIGRTIAATLTSTASGYGNLYGMEIATSIDSGGGANHYGNLYLMRYSSDAAQGLTTDRSLGIWNQYAQGATLGSKAAIDIGPQGQSGLYFPVAQNGNLIQASKGASDGSLTVNSLIDFSAISTVSAYIFNSVNFSVDGSGNVFGNSFRYHGSGNTSLELLSGGNGGFNLESSDGFLMQVTNAVPGTGTTAYVNFQAGTGTAFVEIAGTATNRSLSINSVGSGSGIGFQSGNAVFIDINGNVNVTSLIVGSGSSPSVTSGTGAPISTQPNGSLYLRKDGSASSRLYVSEGGGTWSAIASS